MNRPIESSSSSLIPSLILQMETQKPRGKYHIYQVAEANLGAFPQSPGAGRVSGLCREQPSAHSLNKRRAQSILLPAQLGPVSNNIPLVPLQTMHGITDTTLFITANMGNDPNAHQ